MRDAQLPADLAVDMLATPVTGAYGHHGEQLQQHGPTAGGVRQTEPRRRAPGTDTDLVRLDVDE
jgi:hypothetical protein